MNKDFDALLAPLIELCSTDTSKAFEQQEELLTMLSLMHADLLRINDQHYKGSDDNVNRYLDKVMHQADRVNTLKQKLENMQKRVQVVESTFKRLKDDIPELKKNVLLAEEKK